MAKYRSKPRVIEAFQWFSTTKFKEFPDWFKDTYRPDWIGAGNAVISVYTNMSDDYKTLRMRHEGDYIIREERGKIYSMSPEEFNKMYEKVGGLSGKVQKETSCY